MLHSSAFIPASVFWKSKLIQEEVKNRAQFSSSCSHSCPILHTVMSIQGEGKTGLRSTSPFRQMKKVGGKQCGSNAEQLLSHSHTKKGREESKHGKGRPKSAVTFLLPTCCMTALAPLKIKASWKALLAFGSRKTASNNFLKNTVIAYSI